MFYKKGVLNGDLPAFECINNICDEGLYTNIQYHLAVIFVEYLLYILFHSGCLMVEPLCDIFYFMTENYDICF